MSITSPRPALPVAQFPSSAVGQWGSEWARPRGWRGARVPRSQPSRLHDAPVVLQEEKPCALLAAWLKEDEQENEVVLKGPGENGWVPTGPGVGGVGGGPQQAQGLGPFPLPGAASGSKTPGRGTGGGRGLVSRAPRPTRVSRGVPAAPGAMGLPMLVPGEPHPCLGRCMFGRGPPAWLLLPSPVACSHYQRKKEAETPETVLLEVVEAQLVRGRACASPCPTSRVGLPGERGPWRCQPRMGYAPAQGGGWGHRAAPAVPAVRQCLTSVLALR